LSYYGRRGRTIPRLEGVGARKPTWPLRGSPEASAEATGRAVGDDGGGRRVGYCQAYGAPDGSGGVDSSAVRQVLPHGFQVSRVQVRDEFAAIHLRVPDREALTGRSWSPEPSLPEVKALWGERGGPPTGTGVAQGLARRDPQTWSQLPGLVNVAAIRRPVRTGDAETRSPALPSCRTLPDSQGGVAAPAQRVGQAGQVGFTTAQIALAGRGSVSNAFVSHTV